MVSTGFGLIVGAVGVAIAIILWKGSEVAYFIGLRLSKSKTKHDRSLFLAAGLDNVFLTLLPVVKGIHEHGATILYIALVFIIMQLVVLMEDPNVLTFCLLIAGKFAENDTNGSLAADVVQERVQHLKVDDSVQARLQDGAIINGKWKNRPHHHINERQWFPAVITELANDSSRQ